MKTLLILISSLFFTGCMTYKSSTVNVFAIDSEIRIDGEIRGSDPSDSLNGNKGELEVPIIPLVGEGIIPEDRTDENLIPETPKGAMKIKEFKDYWVIEHNGKQLIFRKPK